MQTHKIHSCLFFLLLIFSTQEIHSYEIKPINYVSTLYSSISGVTQEVCDRFDWTVSGSGGGMMDSIYEVDIAFATNHPLTQERARQVLVYAADAYLKAINTNPPVRPFLRNFPFLVNNLCISIVSHNEQVSQSNPASTIKLAFIGVNGKLIFGGGEWIIGHYAEDGTWCPSYYNYEFKETYEEAKAKLPTQSP